MSDPLSAEPLFSEEENTNPPSTTKRNSGTRANDLPGKNWTKNSISVWSDLRKDQEELSLGHPAIFPKSLVLRLLESFTRSDERVVLDPFAGSGSTLLASMLVGKTGIGFEISEAYIALANRRRDNLPSLFDGTTKGEMVLHNTDARKLLSKVSPGSVDICITSPPYWDVLTQRRSADNKEIRNYGNDDNDLGRIADYNQFLHSLLDVFAPVLAALKPRGYCLVNVMDLRKGPRFYPYHADLANALHSIGFIWDDLIIWDRRSEYNNMRPLGYPAVFRVNKAHEFILIMQKPG